MQIHIGDKDIIDGIAYVGEIGNGINIDTIPDDFELGKYKFVDNEFVRIGEYELLTIEEAIARKTKELSECCNNAITNGIELDGHHYSMTSEDQINMDMLKNAISDGMPKVKYHADGESCRFYDAAEFINIYLMCVAHKTQQTTYFNQLREYVGTLTSTDDISKVVYGQELTGKYLDEFNETCQWLMEVNELYNK